MRYFKKFFCETPITWRFLLIYSIATGVIVGLLNCIPFLENTSFVAPAVTLEYWFVAAIFIISNCKRASEAVVKTFLFFLISQPLIYLVEVPFKELGWGLFGYYKYWFFITVLTIPGALIAFHIKRGNAISALVLSVATGFLAVTGIGAVKGLFTKFPFGLVTVIFCFSFCIILIQVILQNKKNRVIAYICTILIAVIFSIAVSIIGSNQTTGIVLEADHQWTVVEADVQTELTGSYLNISSNQKGTYSVIVKNEVGKTIKYEITFGDSIIINQID